MLKPHNNQIMLLSNQAILLNNLLITLKLQLIMILRCNLLPRKLLQVENLL
jgi:hypothetical protein